jgi:hypothetical protein
LFGCERVANSATRGKLVQGNPSGGNFTLTLDSALTLGDGWKVEVRNSGTSGQVILAASQAVAFEGQTFTARALELGESMLIRCDGTAFKVASRTPPLMGSREPAGWDGFARGFLDRQIAKQSEECGERNAHRFVMAMQFGGCTDAEAYEVMRDRFCAHMGSGIELWAVGDVPTDRWFRDAWVRSHNGGPIGISVAKARGIHFRKIKHAVESENKRRLEEIEQFDHLIEPNWGAIREAIRRADDPTTLQRVWSRELGATLALAKLLS